MEQRATAQTGIPAPTIQHALAELLAALGFAAMARDCATEQRGEVLRKYARVILRATPEPRRRELHTHFAMLRLV